MPRSPSPLSSRSRSRTRSLSRSRSLSRTPEPVPEAEACPFLIRVFVTKGKHTPLVDFDEGRFPVQDEFQVHGWKHSTPISLIQQLFSVFPAPYRSSAARYSFKQVYVDASERGLYRAKELVSFTGRDFMATVGTSTHSRSANGTAMSLDRGLDDAAPLRGEPVNEKTLDAYGFLTGDLLSIAITVPEPRAAAGSSAANGAGAAGTSIRGAFARERASYSDRDAPPHATGERWARGAALPPPGRGRRDAPTRAPSGSWRADPPARGGGARRASPDWGRGRSRSRSPERRESWSRRRD